MKKYRKKPVVIEAIKFEYTQKGVEKLYAFCCDEVGAITKERPLAEAHIYTLEDGEDKRVKHVATEGDYIIKGVRGEFYPCKPDIFDMTYEEVSEERE